VSTRRGTVALGVLGLAAVALLALELALTTDARDESGVWLAFAASVAGAAAGAGLREAIAR
jgi:hypothetical protein